jgi:hypothetical protein
VIDHLVVHTGHYYTKEAFYSDSYGMPPEDEIINFVRPKKFYYNKDKQFQPTDKNYCGEWTLLTAYFLKNNEGSLKNRFADFASNFADLS